MSRDAEDLNRRLLRARDAMDRAYAEPLDVRAVAAVAHISEAHFSRSFRAVFGETPHRYLQRRRVERSMFLLRETDRSVTDVCLDVGFTSLGTFSRTFREIVGESPSAYRAGHGPMVAPNCWQMAATRPRESAGAGPAATANEQFRRSRRRGGSLGSRSTSHRHRTGDTTMTTRLAVTSIKVLDQEEALDFYVNKLGPREGPGHQAGPLPLADGPRSRPTPRSRSSWRSPARPCTTRRPPSSSASSSPRARWARSSSTPTTPGRCTRRSRSAASRTSPRSR